MFGFRGGEGDSRDDILLIKCAVINVSGKKSGSAGNMERLQSDVDIFEFEEARELGGRGCYLLKFLFLTKDSSTFGQRKTFLPAAV